MSDTTGHRIYYFVNPRENDDPTEPLTLYSYEADSVAEARIVLGERLHVTALSLVDVTDYLEVTTTQA